MALKMTTYLQSIAVLGIVAFSFSTSSVRAASTESLNALPLALTDSPDGWTWTDLGGQVAGWAAAGAAAGAVECALVGTPVGALCGAAVGTISGAVGGAAYYGGTQLWEALIEYPPDPSIVAPANSLD
jgi:hypothetical protein